MKILCMTYNIQHGLDYMRRDRKSLKDFEEMTPEYLEKLKAAKPAAEDPSLIDLSQIARAIQDCGAEIIALNEVRDVASGWSDPCFTHQVQEVAARVGYSYYHFGRAIDIEGKGLYGNALISKYPITHVETIAIPDPEVQDEPTWYESRSLIRADIELPSTSTGTKGITVMVTHMGLARAEAQNAVATILAHMPQNRSTILMGDFNLTPDSPILQPLLEVFHDAGTLLPEPENYTYPPDAPERKIDYIMAQKQLPITGTVVPAVTYSDHRPMTAYVEV